MACVNARALRVFSNKQYTPRRRRRRRSASYQRLGRVVRSRRALNISRANYAIAR